MNITKWNETTAKLTNNKTTHSFFMWCASKTSETQCMKAFVNGLLVSKHLLMVGLLVSYLSIGQWINAKDILQSWLWYVCPMKTILRLLLNGLRFVLLSYRFVNHGYYCWFGFLSGVCCFWFCHTYGCNCNYNLRANNIFIQPHTTPYTTNSPTTCIALLLFLQLLTITTPLLPYYQQLRVVSTQIKVGLYFTYC